MGILEIENLSYIEQNSNILDNDSVLSSNNKLGVLAGTIYKYSTEDLGYYVDLGENKKGFIPNFNYEDSDYSPSRFALSRIGNKIVGYYAGERSDGVILMNRKGLQKDIKESLKSLAPGSIFDTYVLSLSPFGAFVDMGSGVPALLPIGDVSIARFNDINSVLSVGMPIKVVYCGYNSQGFVVSHKELLGTWEENLKDYNSGDYCLGIIRELKPYGIFIELTPNLTGLADYPTYIDKDSLKVGTSVNVVFKSKNPDSLKVKLSILKCANIDYKVKYNYRIKSGILTDWLYTPKGSKKEIKSSFVNNKHIIDV